LKRNLIASLLFACAVILAVAADVAKDKPFPPVEIKEPIISMMMASSVAAAASPASPSPTPAGDQYLITWKMTARGHSKGVSDKSAEFVFEATQSSASEGQAVVKFDAKGYRLEGRILKGYLSDEQDTKTLVLSHKILCGPLAVWDHDHYSLRTLEPMSGPDGKKVDDPCFWMCQAPRKQPDGSWLIEGIFSDWWSYVARHHFATLHLNQEWRDRYHYEGGNVWLADKVTSGPIHTVCDGDNLVRSDLKLESARVFDYQGHANPVEPITGFDVPKNGRFSVPSTGPTPDLFSKEWKYRVLYNTCSGPGSCGTLPVDVDWTITVRRLGKCHVSGEIPINDNPDIKDEEIEMGVEHGSDTIDPDKGVAALNVRLTCDTVPIKNAKVNIKVDVQKNTGGHTHDPAGRPRGSLNGTKLTDAKPSIQEKTDDDGRIHLTFKAGKAKNHDDLGIAGIYRFTATSVRCPDRKAEVAVEAKVDGLSHLDADANYVNDIHGDSHTSGDNATAATKKALAQFAKKFHDAQVEHNDQLAACGIDGWPLYPLWVIDVSLPFGGLYDDIHDDWQTPHQTHGRGDGVDFSVKSAERCPTCTTAWPDAAATTPVCDGYRVAAQGWLIATMMRLGMEYGHWDEYDLCQHPNVCTDNGSQWLPCCPDNKTCGYPPGGIGPPLCPGDNSHCLHCPTDQLWHLHVNQ
jgi:hypothetical protein